MPGPVSDSYDPVWGTAANADEVREAIRAVRSRLADMIQAPPEYILNVIRGPKERQRTCRFTVRELRILRFACGVALEEEGI